MKHSLSLMLLLTAATSVLAQDRRDAATYAEKPKNEFYEKIKKDNESFFTEKADPEMRFTMDYSSMDVPKSMNEFKIVTADKPVSQGLTGTCWCFSTTSFYESEA